MDEIVIARPVRSAVVLTGVFAGLLFIGTTAASFGWAGAFFGALATVAVVWRFAQMKLSVTRRAVVVVNFLSRDRFPLDTVRIVDRKDRPPRLSDAGGKLDTTGRTLHLTDSSGREAQIELAPVYGSRLDDIAEDLYRAIAKMQAEGPAAQTGA